MATYRVTVSGKGLREAAVRKAAEAAADGKVYVSVEKVKIAQSRADRLAEVSAQAGAAQTEAESLREELQEWFDNLPENFQMGEKGEALEAAIETLGEVVEALEQAVSEAENVEFPGMY